MDQKFLVEIGVEEIPSQYLAGMADSFRKALERELTAARLQQGSCNVSYTPRRLVAYGVVAARQRPKEDLVRGPTIQVAYRDGAATPALEGFLRRVQLSAQELEHERAGGKEYLVARVKKPVRSAVETLPTIVQSVLLSLPMPRGMRWNNSDYRFVRPVRWFLLLLDDRVLQGEVMGVRSGTATYGNRTDHPGPISVTSVDSYWMALKEGLVMLDAQERQQRIVSRGNACAAEIGGYVDWDSELLEEVTNLVEWPTPFAGSFDAEFLQVPEPILITSMRVHQRYFPVKGADKALLPAFIAVRNGVGEDLQLVRKGNEKVLRARLSDARYFFLQDRQRALADNVGRLAQVTLHAKLGTYHDKVERLIRLFQNTKSWWRLDPDQDVMILRSVTLYKGDLLTHVVQEFPELQGEMGGIYAALDGEADSVAEAIRDQYRPAFPGDYVPQTTGAQLLGLLDRVDTLMEFFSAGIKPTGSEDPFGLRRVALGVGRIVSETPILGSYTLTQLLKEAAAAEDLPPIVVKDVYQLVKMRLVSMLEERWPESVVAATLDPELPWEFLENRLSFLANRLGDPQLARLLAAAKRVARIVGQDPGVLSESEAARGVEADLQAVVGRIEETAHGDLEAWWHGVQETLPIIEQFFEEILVMDPDIAVRERRLALLARVRRALYQYYAWDRM